ncbi:MAG: HDOD domain-containing protein [Massilia sp.]|nr:HDOD domain-containing protein [Massilia sp.]
MGGSDSGASRAGPSAQARAEEQERQVGRLEHDIDVAYYHWLTGSAGFAAPAELESAMLAEARGLLDRPADAAGLVPRVPEVITQLLGSLGDDGASAAELKAMVAQDVVLVAEVIREANSSYFSSMAPVNTIEAALMRLGQAGLRMLLARIAFRPVIKMQKDGFASRAAPRVWQQSERCALAASLVASGLSAGAFEAYLAGLIQNVGLIVAFRVADRLSPKGAMPRSSEFGLGMLAVGRELSAAIARHWEFPQDVCDAIAEAGEPGTAQAQALALGDRIAKLRLLIDADVIAEDDALVTDSLNSFQRRCLGKLENLES